MCPRMGARNARRQTSDNSALWQNWFNSLGPNPAPPCIEFGEGPFKFSSPVTYTFPGVLQLSVTVRGQGADVTNLVFPASNGLTLNYTSITHSSHVRDLSFVTGANGTYTGLALSSNAATAVSDQSDVTRVTFRGATPYTNYWGVGVQSTVVGNVNFLGDDWIGGQSAGPNFAGNGVYLVGDPGTTRYGFQYNFTQCNWFAENIGIQYGSYIQGVVVDQGTFSGSTGINLASSLSGLAAELTVSNSQFATIGNGIGVGTYIYDYNIANNLFFVAPSVVGIAIGQNGGGSITGNTFVPAPSAAHASNYGITIATTAANFATSITGNNFSQLSNGILLNTGSTNVNVQSNAYANVSTNTTNIGTGNTIGGGSP